MKEDEIFGFIGFIYVVILVFIGCCYGVEVVIKTFLATIFMILCLLTLTTIFVLITVAYDHIIKIIRDNIKLNYRIVTDGKKFSIQFREKKYLFFGKKVWKDRVHTEKDPSEFNLLEAAKDKLKELVHIPKLIEDNKKEKTHVEVELDFDGVKIPF